MPLSHIHDFDRIRQDRQVYDCDRKKVKNRDCVTATFYPGLATIWTTTIFLNWPGLTRNDYEQLRLSTTVYDDLYD